MKKTLTIYTLASMALIAQAQEKKTYTNFADTTFNLQEVVVHTNRKARPQVTKLDVPMKYLPLSVNSLEAGSLEIRGIRNIQEATRFMPGIRIQTSYGAFQQISVRGFDHAVMMVDGIRDERSAINNSYPIPDLSSVESIELLKGPASVLYGHSAVGGILNIVRKAPSERPTVNARLAYGSFENKEATLGMGGKLVGPVNYYANVNYADQEGWRDNGNRRFSGYLALSAQITPDDRLEIRSGFNRDFYGTEIGLPPIMSNDIYNTTDDQLYLHKNDMLPGLDREARYNNESDFMKNYGWNISGQYTHQFSEGMKLTDRLSFSADDINYFGTETLDYLESDEPIYDHYYWKGPDEKRYICLDTVYLSYPLRFSHIAKTVSNSLELSGHFQTGEVKHNYMGGYAFVALNRNSYTGYNLGDDVQGPGLYSHVSVYDPHSMGYMTSKFSKATVTHHYANSLYLQDLLELGERWKVLAALRADFFRYLSASADTPTGKREYESHGSFNRIRNRALTYRLGAVYLPHPNTSLYASFATFFKPIRTFYQDNVVYVDANGERFTPTRNEEVFKPEKGYQAEVGIKYDLNQLLHANASLFYIRKMNSTTTLSNNYEMEVDGQPVTGRVIGQVGTQDSKGFDFDVTLTPTPTLALTIGYGLNDSKIRRMKEIKDPELAAAVYGNDPQASKDNLNSQEGNWQANVPNQTFYAYGSYTIPKGVFRDLEFHLSSSYTGKVYRDAANSTWFDPYWITDLGASYTINGHTRLTVNINNLFDNSYYNQALGNQLVPSMPRNFQVAISYTL
ncbi:MAG TPA: TonB-dependent receptor [Candidatus Parabacteroides intestinipullorum]|uniref:TonB-dependent receptor n=1 Tax=Candidatus Parabacteroides intestinipullorum TaxID=2838723 RepID=A0A9D1X842_9BACT|nr:TonB-dependent receptor [Candidatus Parabacteroides intestinipullorum]